MRQSVSKNYLLCLLMVILAANYMDRLALGIVLQDIKTDLHLTDTELGLLTGIAFALFYSVMGIPIARWADRGNRVAIISVTTALWSAMVALCGAATSFLQLLLIRVGVAIGEAGCLPSALSLIADYFTRAERPRAVARYMLGGSLALTVGFFAAGWLNELYGWRVTFVAFGLPGLGLAALAWFTLKEPRPLESPIAAARASPAADAPRLKDVCSTLWRNTAFRHLLICYSVWGFFGSGMFQWQPAFFIRSHGLQTGELGTWLALVYGIGSGLGIYLGGEWAARYAARNETRQLNVCAWAFGVFGLLNACAYLAPGRLLAFGALTLASIGGNIAQGPILATMQTLVPGRMRAVSIALVYLFFNLIGGGLGPLAAGALSDALRPWLGEESLRFALVILCPGYLWAAWHLWRASRTVVRDLELSQEEEGLAAAQSELAVIR
jgi:MFS family permease